MSLKHIRIVSTGFLLLLATSVFPMEINRSESILVDFKGISFVVTQSFCGSPEKICKTTMEPLEEYINNKLWDLTERDEATLKEINYDTRSTKGD